jgi:predicted PurR-regulated permease PerM
VPLATSFLTFLWSLLVLFFMVAYLVMLFYVVVDVFRRRDASGGKKALWLLFLLFVPLLGLIVYLLTNSEGMAERHSTGGQRSQAEVEEYIRTTAAASGADQIAKAKELLDAGAITQDEYDKLKAKALG